MLFGISIVYASMSVLIFTIYIIMLQIIPWKKNETRPKIIPSGGKGSDDI